MSEDKQAVATEADDPASGTDTDAGGAQEEPTLDALLSEWGADESEPTKATTGTQSQPKNTGNHDGGDNDQPEKNVDPDELYKDFEKRMEAKQKADADLQEAIKVVKGENIPLDNEQVEDILDGMARRNPALARAWQMRHKNPDRWQQTLKALNKQLSAKFAPQDKSVEDTDKAVASAVHSAATKTPNNSKDKDAFNMSPKEWEEHRMKKFGSV